MSDALETRYFADINGLIHRAELFADQDAESPRTDGDWQLALLLTEGDRYSPDDGSLSDWFPGEYVTDGRYPRVDTRRASKYLAIAHPEILAYQWLENPSDSRSGLATAGTGDSGQYVNGIGIVTRDKFYAAMMRTAGPDGPAEDRLQAESIIAGEVESYRAWQMGEYVGAVVSTREGDDWEEIESCWSFESDDAAMQWVNDVVGTLENEMTESQVDDAFEDIENDAAAEIDDARAAEMGSAS